jgi:hypothetical protein
MSAVILGVDPGLRGANAVPEADGLLLANREPVGLRWDAAAGALQQGRCILMLTAPFERCQAPLQIE